MGVTKEMMKSAVREPWFYSIALLSVTPLFPDYFCFPLIFAAFALALIDAKKQGRQVSFGKLGFMMLAYLGYMAISLVYSDDINSSFWTWMMWACVFLAYLTVTTVVYERRRLRATVLCMTAATGAVGTVTVVQYILREAFHLQISDKLWNGLDTMIYGWLNFPLSTINLGDRVSGTFNNPNILATYLVLTIPFSIAFVMTGTRSRPKAIARIALVLTAYAVGFSFCRGAYLALMAVGALLIVLFIRKRFIMTVLAVIYVMLLIPPSISDRMLSVVPQNADQPADTVQMEMLDDDKKDHPHALDQITQGYKHDNSVSMRFVMWKQVIKNSVQQPLLGAGLGVGSTQQTLGEAGLKFVHAHNLFLELFAEGGILSLAFFGGIIWLLVERGRKLLLYQQDSEAWLLGFAIFAACLSICILGVFDFPLLTPRINTTCMLLMGVTETAARIYLKVAVPELRDIKHAFRMRKAVGESSYHSG